MIAGYGSVTQALLGTLFTWGLTAAGSAMVIFLRGNQRKTLDTALGFAAGVMTAASFWSLLCPAIDMAEKSGMYGLEGQYAFLPVAGGFLFGSIFVFAIDKMISYLGINDTTMMIALTTSNKDKADLALEDSQLHLESGDNRFSSSSISKRTGRELSTTVGMDSFSDCIGVQHTESTAQRRKRKQSVERAETYVSQTDREYLDKVAHWKRIMLLVVAITVHNIPEGLAVGVSFGAIGTVETATFEAARNLAIGIGIQNFPEGLAVSLPLHAAGFSLFKSFWYGQLSGMVEPIFGILGAVAVSVAQLILPYALSFAAGAMIYIVVDDIIPEAHAAGNSLYATWGCVIGFVVMMCLDVGLG